MATSLPPDTLETSAIDFLDFLPFGGSFDLPSTSTPPYAIPDRLSFEAFDGGVQIGDAEAGPSGRYRDEVSFPYFSSPCKPKPSGGSQPAGILPASSYDAKMAQICLSVPIMR